MRIDHINLRCSDLDATRDFLRDVIGLKQGERPPFTFPGYWMYDDTGRPCAHLIAAKEGLGPPGAVDHVAFFYEDLPAQITRMKTAGFNPDFRSVPGTDRVQGFITGPDGIQYEIQGPTSD